MQFRAFISLLACIGIGNSLPVNPSDFNDSQITTRDVCVIGGGSAGTYAAIRLRQNGSSVAVVEQNGRLGGHTESYIDPATNTPVDFGVLLYHNITLVEDYFDYLNISVGTEPADDGTSEPRRFDFRSGDPMNEPRGNITEGMTRYVEQLLRYSYLSVGFDLPDPVPEDLLLPFGEFAEKYELGPAVDIIGLYVQGVGDVLKLQTIYVMKYFSIEVVQGVQNGFLRTTNHNNAALYAAAYEELANDTFLNSNVVTMDRDSDPDWVYAVVQNPEGRHLIRARRVVSAIPPKLENLKGFDLDKTEWSLFDQFSNTNFYTALAKIEGLPLGTTIINRANDTVHNLPPMPAIYVLKPTDVPNLYNIVYGSEDPMSESEVKDDMVRAVQSLQKDGLHTSTPEFPIFKPHTPFQLRVPSEAIANGFYSELRGLQGRRRTYYTGAAFEGPDSSRIWRFTEVLLQTRILKELGSIPVH